MTLSSYRKNRVSSGQVSILRDMDLDVRGRNVLIVDDVLDSGPHVGLRQGFDRGARGQNYQVLRLARQKGKARSQRRGRFMRVSSAQMFLWLATAWTWRIATVSCPSWDAW